jgi:hypothetical protein
MIKLPSAAKNLRQGAELARGFLAGTFTELFEQISNE